MGHLIVPETGVQLFRGEAFLTSLLLVSTLTTAAIVTSGAAQSVAVTSSAKFSVGDLVTLDAGNLKESVVITAIVDATHISGIFTHNHASGVTISKSSLANVPMGQIQEFDYDDTIDLKEMRGPRSRMAIAVAQSGAKISGSCKFGSSNPQILAIARGAEVTVVTANGQTFTRVRRKGSQNVTPFVIELYDVDNEYGTHALFSNVIITDLKNPMKLDDFTVWDATFTMYPDKQTDIVYELFYPGDLTAAYALPSQYTPDDDVTTLQTNYTNQQATQTGVQQQPQQVVAP